MKDNLPLKEVLLMAFFPWLIGGGDGGLIVLVEESCVAISLNCGSNVSCRRVQNFSLRTISKTTFDALIDLSTNA